VSELFDSHNKPSDDFQKLLRERLDKANPHRTKLTAEEKTKLAKLEGIAERLRRGENV
jgi:hypothetical protein